MAILLLITSGIYVLAAQGFESSGMGYVSGALGTASSALLLHDLHRLEWYAAGFAAFTLAGAALALSRLNRGSESRLSAAYSDLCVLYTCAGGIALGIRCFLSAAGEAPALNDADWPAGVVLGLVAGGTFGALAFDRREARFVLPFSAALLFSLTLFTERVLRWNGALPVITLAHSLLPFVVLNGWMAATLLKRAEKDEEIKPFALMLLPALAAATAVGMLVSLADGLERGSGAAFWTSMPAYTAIMALFAQALPERFPGWKPSSAFAAATGLIAMGGFAGHELYPTGGALSCAITMGLAGWALLALSRVPSAGFWRAPLSASALAAAGVGGLLAGMGSERVPSFIALGAAINGALALSMTDGEAVDSAAVVSAGCAALGILHLAAVAPIYGVLFALGGAAALALRANRLNRPDLAWLGLASAAAAGLLGSLETGYSAPLTEWLAIGSMAAGSAWAFYSARKWKSAEFSYAGGFFCLGAYVRTALAVAPLPSEWIPLAVLPLLAAVYATGLALKVEWESVMGRPLRELTLGASVIACGAAALLGVGIGDLRVASVTLAAYGGAFALRASIRAESWWTGLAGGTLAAGAGYALADAASSRAQWAAGYGLVAFALMTAAVVLASRQEAAHCLHRLTAGAASVVTLVALVSAGETGQGIYSILALAESGAVFAGQAAMLRREPFAHAAFASWFAAYGLILYDQFGFQTGFLDFYLLPLAAYLLALSFFVSRQGADEPAAQLWTIGLLALFTPTYVAFHANFSASSGSPVHALLLLVECVAAIAWGIAHRIRAFVLSGAAFSTAFVITLGSGAIMEVWTGMMSVIVGLALLGFVFYVSLHHDTLRLWLRRFTQEWSRWR
jgi:hypothetical protein